jgi:hypothetical protein
MGVSGLVLQLRSESYMFENNQDGHILYGKRFPMSGISMMQDEPALV